MTPEDIRALRQELSCTARELATTLGVDQETVFAWERGALFPTKRYVTRMQELRQRGPSAIARQSKNKPPVAPLQALADPELWRLLRKLIAHPELRRAAAKLAESYGDPAEQLKVES